MKRDTKLGLLVPGSDPSKQNNLLERYRASDQKCSTASLLVAQDATALKEPETSNEISVNNSLKELPEISPSIIATPKKTLESNPNSVEAATETPLGRNTTFHKDQKVPKSRDEVLVQPQLQQQIT